ncbi:hypothetical protein IQ07DRAFT_65667 [Pyrenochaeta sp. DS3sAY3a]|nr:hypothetical protein IQ07DRAFT_65667 [Pyrenochaeta sp. DS3sAY3a]
MEPSSYISGASWRPVHHYSSLPYGWMPKDVADFFKLFVRHLKETWLLLCNEAEDHLSRRRQDQLRERGNSPEMIHRLAEDALEWAKLRTMLRGQNAAAKEFIVDYQRYDQGQDRKNMHEALDEFVTEVTDRIERLDQTVKEILQFEFAWVSINEAHRSTSLATSMKRLSWITFIFLPAMFASSLFGMNVNVLENNPDWRWFMLFLGCLLIVTVVVWLLFKYGQVSYQFSFEAAHGTKWKCSWRSSWRGIWVRVFSKDQSI